MDGLINRARFVSAFAVLAGILLAGCNNGKPLPILPDSCVLTVTPDPSVGNAPVSVSATAVDPETGLSVPVPYVLESSPLPADPVTQASDPVTVASGPPSPGAFPDDGISLGQGIHAMLIGNPCSKDWFRYEWAVDLIAPIVSVDPDGGYFREDVTIQIGVDDVSAQLATRFYLSGSVAPEFAVPGSTEIILDNSGEWIVEAQATDPYGNASSTATATIQLDTLAPALIGFDVSLLSGGEVGLYPRITLTFDRPMDQTVDMLADAVTFSSGSPDPRNLMLIWNSGTVAHAWPDQRLTSGETVWVDVSALAGASGSPQTPGPVNNVQTAVVCSTCTNTAYQLELLPGDHFVPATEGQTAFRFDVNPPAPDSTIFSVSAFGNDGDSTTLTSGLENWSITDRFGDGSSFEVTVSADAFGQVFYSPVLVWVVAGQSSIRHYATGISAGLAVFPAAPMLLSTHPSTDVSLAPVQAIDLGFNVLMNPDSVQDGSTLLINGIPGSFDAFGIPDPAANIVRIEPLQNLESGDLVQFTAGATVEDVWGRSLGVTTFVEFTVEGLDTVDLSYTWNRADGSSVDLGAGTVILAGYVEPPVTGIKQADLVHVSSGHTFPLIDSIVRTSGTRHRSQGASSWVSLSIADDAPQLPDGGYRVEITPDRTLDGSSDPAMSVVSLIYDPDDVSPSLIPEQPTGRGVLLTREDGTLPGPIQARVNDPRQLALDLELLPDIGIGSVQVTTVVPYLDQNIYFYSSANTSIYNLLTNAPAVTGPGAEANIDASITGDGIRVDRTLQTFAPNQIPQPITPTAGARYAATDYVEFSWSLTDDTAFDALRLQFFYNEPTTVYTRWTDLYTVLPGTRNFLLPVFAFPRPVSGQGAGLGTPVSTATFNWIITGVKSGASPHNPLELGWDPTALESGTAVGRPGDFTIDY